MLATFSFLPQTRFTPIPKIRMEPIRERYETARSVITGATSRASSVMQPSNTNTGMTENKHPRPSEEVITTTMIKSSTDFTAKVE